MQNKTTQRKEPRKIDFKRSGKDYLFSSVTGQSALRYSSTYVSVAFTMKLFRFLLSLSAAYIHFLVYLE